MTETDKKEIDDLMVKYYNKSLGESIDYRTNNDYKSIDITTIFYKYIEEAKTKNQIKALYNLIINLK